MFKFWSLVFLMVLLVDQSYFLMMMLVMMLLVLMFISGFKGVHLSMFVSFFFMDLTALFMMLLTIYVMYIGMGQSFSMLIPYSSTYIYLMIILNSILLLTFSVSYFVYMYFFYELSLIPMMVMIMGWGYQPERLAASTSLMIYTVTASMPLLMSLIFLEQEMNSQFFYFLKIDYFKNFELFLYSFFVMLAFLAKLPIYGLHLWLPMAHVEAPFVASMILASILLKLGGYGILRFFTLLNSPGNIMVNFFCSFSVMGGLYASMICIRQNDVKKMIAYSSVAHMSLIVGSLGLNSQISVMGGLMMMVAHGFTSGGLFFMAHILYYKMYSRNMLIMKNISNSLPFLSFLAVLLSVINMASPPSINLWAEMSLISSYIQMSVYYLFPTGFMVFMAAAYSLMLYNSVFHGNLNVSESVNMSFISTSSLLTLLLFILPSFLLSGVFNMFFIF